MGIQNFPAALQPIIQENWLVREFEEALRSQVVYRSIADRESFPNSVGETVTRTRRGLKAPTTTPIAAAANTGLDNGLSASGWAVEQYTMGIDMYADTQDLNTVQDRVGIVRKFIHNARTNGVQARQSLDRLARNALFDHYLAGNTRVRTTLGAPGVAVAVDDVRGFQYVWVNGVKTAVSVSNPMTVIVDDNTYTLNSVAVDGSNVSTTPNGISGVLTFSGNVTVDDGTAGKAVVSSIGPAILRPSGRVTTAAIQAGDYLTMSLILDAVTVMRNNNVPDIGGFYHLYCDPSAMRGLFRDTEFQLLFRGLGIKGNPEFRVGMVFEVMDVRIFVTTEAYQQTLTGLKIRRPIICGQGAIIEGTFDGQAAHDTDVDLAEIQEIDNVVMVTRSPMDRLQQQITQSWYWIGGYAVPSDITANATIIPTASSAAYKRAIVLECL